MTRRNSSHLGSTVVFKLTAWVAVSFLSAVQSSLRDPSREWSSLLAGNLLAWFPWLLLSIPIVRLSRAGWREGRRAAWIGRHVILAGACSALYLGYLAVFRSLPNPAALGAWRQEMVDVAGEHLIGTLLVYALIATAGRLLAPRETPAVAGTRPPRGFPVRRRGRTRFVVPAEIDWIAAEGSYARLHLGEQSELLRRPLSRLAEELAPCGFVRVHRSALVRTERVRQVEPAGHGDATLVLDDGTRVRLSRTYRAAFDRAMTAG